MSTHSALLLYLLLEQGSLQNAGGVLFRPLCNEDRWLEPPLVSAVRSPRKEAESLHAETVEEEQRLLDDRQLIIAFATPESEEFTLHAVPTYFITRGLNAESCFGFVPGAPNRIERHLAQCCVGTDEFPLSSGELRMESRLFVSKGLTR